MDGDDRLTQDIDLEEVDEEILGWIDLLGTNVDTVDEMTMAYLRKIELALRSEMAERRKAEDEVRRHSLTVASIAEASGVSRRTFYNRPLLIRYVNMRHAKALGRTEASINASLRRRNDDLKRKLELMEGHAAEMVQLMMENDDLKRRLRSEQLRNRGGLPGVGGKGEVIPLNSRRYDG